MSVILILISYFFLLVFFSFRRGKEFKKSHSLLLKCFFPNWRFFEYIRPIPILYARYQIQPEIYSPWVRVVPQRKRNLKSLFINSEGNFTLALYTAIENFAAVSMENEDIEPLQSEEYKIVNSIIRTFLKNKDVANNCVYQFKIQVESPSLKEDVIISPELRMDQP